MHSTTHTLCPWHYAPTVNGERSKTIDEIPLEWCYGDGPVIDMNHKEDFDPISVQDIQGFLNKEKYQIRTLKKLIKSLVFPVTLLTVATLFSILMAAYSLYLAFTHVSDFAIYPAVWIPITLILIFLYAIERMLIKKITYYKLMVGELVMGILTFFIFSYLNSNTEINFHTDQDYILVVFDAKENSMSKFEKKGVFGKELNLYNTNKAHLDRSTGLRKDLRINPPKEWQAVFYREGKYTSQGDSIKYVYSFKETRDKTRLRSNAVRASDSYIDSLLNQEIK